jgi:hypothetical protein
MLVSTVKVCARLDYNGIDLAAIALTAIAQVFPKKRGLQTIIQLFRCAAAAVIVKGLAIRPVRAAAVIVYTCA